MYARMPRIAHMAALLVNHRSPQWAKQHSQPMCAHTEHTRAHLPQRAHAALSVYCCDLVLERCGYCSLCRRLHARRGEPDRVCEHDVARARSARHKQRVRDRHLGPRRAGRRDEVPLQARLREAWLQLRCLGSLCYLLLSAVMLCAPAAARHGGGGVGGRRACALRGLATAQAGAHGSWSRRGSAH